jgi:nitrogen fixation protein NifX
MRVVVATQDRKNVNGHFGSARIFQFFELDQDESRFLEECEFETVSSEDGTHGPEAEGRLERKIEVIKGSALVFVTGIGGSVSNRVKKVAVHPVKLPEAEPIPALLARIQAMLREDPPIWLRRILAAEGASAGTGRDGDDSIQ